MGSHFTLNLLKKQNNEVQVLSKANVDLWQLIRRNIQHMHYGSSNISYVLKDTVIFRDQDSIQLGVIDYRIRFKYPISANIQKQFISAFESQRDLKLKVVVYQVVGLEEGGKFYAALSLGEQMHTTPSLSHRNPVYDFECFFDLASLEDYQQKTFRVDVFDDFLPLDDQNGSDCVGQAEIPMEWLRHQDAVCGVYPLKLKNKAVGKVIVAISKASQDVNVADFYQ